MKAVTYAGAGGVDVIEVAERPDPVPGPGQVRVRVHAAGLNRADVIQRRGAYPAPAGWPADVPGLEYAGVVESAGEGVSRWQMGDRVMGLVGGGAQAEFVTVAEDEALAIPAGLDFEQASAIPEAFLTAYDALVIRGRVAAGDRVLVHAVGSGVGTAAVQLIKWIGATAVGTSRTAAKLEQARTLGLDCGVDTSRGWSAASLEEPVDVILDFLGGAALAENLAALAPRGRLVLLGTLQGGRADGVDLGRVLRGRLEVIGSVMRSRGSSERVPLVQRFGREVLPQFAVGAEPRLRPVLGAIFPMEAVARAHEVMEGNEVFGKIGLRIG